MTTPGHGPRSGDGTYHLVDDALATLAQRRGVWPGDDLTAITLLASLIDRAGWRSVPARCPARRRPSRCRGG